MKPLPCTELKGDRPGYWLTVGALGALVLAGLWGAWQMEHHGHVITGMDNSIVWGVPHVFAVFLIVAASGALNVASIGSVFGRTVYKPLAPLSGLLAIALLIGGLAILVLDLGRPDRLIVAMTYYNFKSIFAWNIFLYVGFLVVVAAYLWLMMEPRMKRFSPPAGLFAFVWRLVLTTGTGSIFGFLVAREAYDAAVMAPLFIAMSFSFGLAIFILVLMAHYGASGRALGDAVMNRLRKLLGIFVAVVLYFVMVQHLTNLYAAEHSGVEAFLLWSGGIYTTLFWIGQVLLGGVLPLIFVFAPGGDGSRLRMVLASVLVIIGGLIQVYVIIIGGQAYPLVLFPGMEVASSFQDGVVATYVPSLYEILLGVGGIGLSLLVVVLGPLMLRFLPISLADERVDPHYKAAAES